MAHRDSNYFKLLDKCRDEIKRSKDKGKKTCKVMTGKVQTRDNATRHNSVNTNVQKDLTREGYKVKLTPALSEIPYIEYEKGINMTIEISWS